MSGRRVVLVGSGYTCVWAYRALRRRLGNRVEIVVVSPHPVHIYHGFTGEVLSGDLDPHLQESPVSEVFPRARFILGSVIAVDPQTRTLTLSEDSRTTTLRYDHVLIATGARENGSLVPGLGEHGWPMREPGMPQALIEHVDLATVDGKKVVVIGGGYTGAEAAAALGRRMIGLGRRSEVVLVSSSSAAIPQWSGQGWLTSKVSENLSRAGVRTVYGARAVKVTADAVHLDDGTVIESGATIMAVGFRAQALPGLDAHTTFSGHLITDETLAVTDGVWAAGDVAQVPRAGGRYAPHDALWAINAGTRAGRNIARSILGTQTKKFAFRGLGSVASFGPGHAVAKMYGVPLAGALAWTIRGGFFLWYIPSRRQALRVITAVSTRRADTLRKERTAHERSTVSA